MTLDAEELEWFRGQRSGSFRRAETGARLLATIDARDQRISQLEEALAELQADHRRQPTIPLQIFKSWHTLDALQADDLD